MVLSGDLSRKLFQKRAFQDRRICKCFKRIAGRLQSRDLLNRSSSLACASSLGDRKEVIAVFML